MVKKSKTSTENIAGFFERLRRDSGLQGQLLGEIAHSAPELLAKVARDHGYTFSPGDLKQLLTDRAQRSLQGEVLWSLVGRADGDTPFVQIKGPSWVNQAPYRKALPSIPEATTTSLPDLFREIESEAP
jgi:hypothetical protein